jgi:hypothetical protein
MPDFFEFKRDNEYVRARLTQQEINGVRTWQSDRLDYQFSFHTQHEAGWPCYLSEPDGPGRNLPKINLKVPTNPPALLQGDSVRSNEVGLDFRDVIRANVPLFQKLARLYYEPEAEEQVPRASWVVLFKCKNDRNAKPVGIKLPTRAQAIPETFWANFKAFAKKPNCPLHRNPICLEAEVTELAATEAAKVKKRYDDNGEIQDFS